jgi:16S rRNA (cytidine1402-2'-O)-methyltransferase
VWKALCESLQPNTRVAVASGVTLPDARISSAPVAQWRKREAPVSNNVPAVFAIGR